MSARATMKPWWSAVDQRAAGSLAGQMAFLAFMLCTATMLLAAWAASGLQPLATLPKWVQPTHLLIGGVAATLVLIGWIVGCVRVWPRLAPTGEGFVTRTEARKDVSEQAARAKAAVTRPTMTRQQRRTAPAAEVGIPLHQAPWGSLCWLALENATGVIAPQQSGKSLTDLLHKTLAAPGPLVQTSTKLDLFRLTARYRERKFGEGTVAVLDLTGTAAWPYRIRWNPLSGCADWRTAKRRAGAFVAGIRPGAAKASGGNHAFFEGRATEVLACYMQAACISGAPLEVFIDWCLNASDTTASDILLTDPVRRQHGQILREAQNLVRETRDGIYESLRDAVSCLTDPLTRATCVDGTDGAGFDTARFLQQNGTVYVLGSESVASDLAPLVTAFVENLLHEAREMPLSQTAHNDRERLDPPLTAVLDELPNICPLPKLPSTLSDSAGRGVLIHWAAQSRAQLDTAFGPEGAETLIDNTTALTVFGGLKSQKTLDWLSALCGRRIEERRSRKSEPLGVNLDRQISQERTEILTPAAIRQIPPGRVLVIYRHLRPMIAVTRKGWELPIWGQLQADRAELAAHAPEHAEVGA